MNGTKVVFDTNALIHFFKGNPVLQNYIPASLYISVISIIEFLSFPKITQEDKELLFEFIQEAHVVDLKFDDTMLIQQIADLRISYKIKLPDAIIAATALNKNAILVTTDGDFAKINSLTVSTY